MRRSQTAATAEDLELSAAGWIFGFWSSRRRDRAGCRTRRRLARRSRSRRRCALRSGKFHALLQPRLIIGRRIDDERAFHAVMAKATKLAANNFVSPGVDRPEPHRDDLSGNRVLRDAHIHKREIVNHILGRNSTMTGLFTGTCNSPRTTMSSFAAGSFESSPTGFVFVTRSISRRPKMAVRTWAYESSS